MYVEAPSRTFTDPLFEGCQCLKLLFQNLAVLTTLTGRACITFFDHFFQLVEGCAQRPYKRAAGEENFEAQSRCETILSDFLLVLR